MTTADFERSSPPAPPLGSADPSRMGQAPGISMQWLFATPLVRMAEWRCVAANGGVGEERSQPWHVIGFPLVGTYRLHHGAESLLVDSNQVMFFNANVGYRTSHPHGFGDSGGSLILRPDLLDEILGLHGASAEVSEPPFASTHRSSSPRVQLLVWLLLRQLSSVTQREDLFIEELAIRIAAEVLRSFRGHAGHAPRPSARGRRRRLAAVEKVKDKLAESSTRNTHLEEMAALAGCSPFHLCRAFRRVTGMSMTAYRTRLRHGAALERLDEDLATLALDLGFSSHSHFTESFRRLFGVPPSTVRAFAKSRREQFLRRIARSLPPPRAVKTLR
jgi:AraC family transcriptional regulator